MKAKCKNCNLIVMKNGILYCNKNCRQEFKARLISITHVPVFSNVWKPELDELSKIHPVIFGVNDV